MKASGIFSKTSVWYYTEQSRTAPSLRLQACLDRCSPDLCDYGCFKGLDSDRMTKIEGFRVKETREIQGQNEVAVQERRKAIGLSMRGLSNSHTPHFSQRQDITMWWSERLGGMLLIRKWLRGLGSQAQRSKSSFVLNATLAHHKRLLMKLSPDTSDSKLVFEASISITKLSPKNHIYTLSQFYSIHHPSIL